MIRFLIRVLIFVVSAALGLLAAQALLDDFSVSANGFLLTVVVFAVIQSVLAPFIAKMTRRYAPAFLGGIGLLSAFVGLLAASLLPDGVTIVGVSTWVLGTLIVWLVTALATFFLPFLLLRKKTGDRRDATPAQR